MQVGGAQGVGGVGGAFGEGAYDCSDGVRVSLGRQYVPDGVAQSGGDRFGTTRGQGSAPGPGAVLEGVEDGTEQWPQGVRTIWS